MGVDSTPTTNQAFAIDIESKSLTEKKENQQKKGEMINNYRTFKVLKTVHGSEPGSLLFLDYNDNIIGKQKDPNDVGTQVWAKGDVLGRFTSLSDFAKCEVLDDGGYCYLDHSSHY